MTSESQKLREDRIALFRKVCREQGIKVTPQRLEIFLEVIGSKNHPSAEDIFSRIRQRMPTVSLDTVYRTLTTFDQCGLITKIHCFEDKTRFDPNPDDHHHLVCKRCKGIVDFHWPELDLSKLPKGTEDWGRIDARQLQLRGICAKCLSQDQSRPDVHDHEDDEEQ